MKNSLKENGPADCEDVVTAKLTGRSGVIGAVLRPERDTVTIDFDPRRLSDAAAGRIIAEVAPELRQNYAKCTLRLSGRACESCALRLERKAEKLKGVRRATATFVGGVMSVSFDQAVLTEAGVEAKLKALGAPVKPLAEAIRDEAAAEESGWRRWFKGERLEMTFTWATLVFMLAGWVAGRLWPEAGWLRAGLYVLAYGTGGFFGVQAGWQSLREKTVDVDLLMVLAALGAAVVGAPFEGAMLLFLFSLSNVLQAYAIDRTRKAISSLMKLRPTQALCRRGAETKLLPIEQLVVGDVLIVRPGESLPLDGVVTEGESTLDEAMLTGESMPVSKTVGSSVFAGTMNQTGSLEVRVSKLAKDSTIAKLIQLVEQAQGEKANTQRFLEKAEQAYAIGVILMTIGLILVPWLIFNQGFHDVFYRAMTVMVVASPCALIISTPASILSAIGGAARRGILFKGGAHLERMAAIQVFAFDKTGTLTRGKPQVTDIIAGGEHSPFTAQPSGEALDLLRLAASIEARSEHPLARAIVNAAQERRIGLMECTAFQSVSGKGASATVNNRRIAAGSAAYFKSLDCAGLAEAEARLGAFQDEGKTCVVIGEINADGRSARILGVIAVADVVRPEAAAVITRLRKLGVKRIAMLTGDHKRVAEAIARSIGVDEVHAQLLPEDKVRVVRDLRSVGPVAMVGDGINDAPALAAADIGIAMGAGGTDVAMETADVVLMNDQLHNIALALDISRRARRVVAQNLIFALSVIVVMVAMTLVGRVPLPVGVVMHEGSTVLVCLNGLRLLINRRPEAGQA
ncbi:MAG: heavy metal translocating P-type ATPase [Verrucomicrobiota bacterium]